MRRLLTPPPADPAERPGLLLWGWLDLVTALGIPRRTIERELAAGRFPQPCRRVGRRPYWRPDDVRRWAEGGSR